ncbi:hypothetical protein [Amycolatopsis antarctica]|uniref:hypothetical protein n=1 Tax=Amycolatopsis antarctica TaxID=1854586 RepID=UPI00196AA510|nr:hypothetical protein [Amycolatopsis antarctica]
MSDHETAAEGGVLSWRCSNTEACTRRQHATDAPGPEGTGSYASAAAVAGLAREVEALRTTVEPLTGVPGQVTELGRSVQALADKAARARPAAGGAPSWLDLPTDIPTVRSVLDELCGWMREVFLRYSDAVRALPVCWLWHPDVVEELLWLMYAWLAAYRDDEGTVAKAGDWHDRYRPGVVRRIKAATGSCSLENHQPRGDRYTGAPVVPVADAIAPLADWWAVHRGEAPPEPDQAQLDAADAAYRRAGGGRR